MQSLKENALKKYGRLLVFAGAIIKNKKTWWRQPLMFCVAAIGIIVFLIAARPVLAGSDGLTGMLNNLIAWLLEIIAGFLGKLILAVIDLLIVVSGYNNFIDAEVVNTGWVLVRDVANMFYIFIMLVIAFGTMLKLEAYTWTKLLPRLIITAVVVNFSRTIMGVIIDFAQVIMITFVNGYAAAAGGNFAQGFSLDAMFKIEKGIIGNDPGFQIILGYLLATVMLAIALVVVGVFLAILIGRIITLWILVILSPLAFLMGTFPKGQEYYSKWWKQFQNTVIVGPILAFFLWLSLATMSGGNSWGTISGGSALGERELETKDLQIGASQAGNIEKIGSFVVSIAMLMIGLQMTQELGVMGAGLAGGAASAIKNTATKVARAVAVPAAGVVATGGVGALGAWTLPMMAGAMGLGKKGLGSWKEKKGFLGMAADIRERAGMRLEQLGVENKGVGKLYGWKYRMGAASEAKVSYRKEKLEEAKKIEHAEAEEKVFEARTGIRLPKVEMAELQLTDEFVKQFGRMEKNQQVQIFNELTAKTKADPTNNETRRMLGGIRSVMALDCRVDDAAGEKEISERLITNSHRTSIGREDVKEGLNLSMQGQQEMLARSALGVGAGQSFNDKLLNQPEVQAQLAKLFQDGKSAAKNSHWQLLHITKFNAEYKDPKTGKPVGRWEINGMSPGAKEGEYVLDDHTWKAITQSRQNETGKAGSKKMMDASPQSWFDHTQARGPDGKEHLYRDSYVGGREPEELLVGFSGKDLAIVNRNNDIQDRALVDVLQGVMSENFEVDENGGIKAMNDFADMAQHMPGLMQRAILFANGKGVKTINGINIESANLQNVPKIMGRIAGSEEGVTHPEQLEELERYGGASSPRDIVGNRGKVRSVEGTYKPEIANDIKSELGLPDNVDLNDDKNVHVKENKKFIDALSDAAVQFGATMDRVLRKIDADIQNVAQTNSAQAQVLSADQDLSAVRSMMASGLKVKSDDQKTLTERMYRVMQRIAEATANEGRSNQTS